MGASIIIFSREYVNPSIMEDQQVARDAFTALIIDLMGVSYSSVDKPEHEHIADIERLLAKLGEFECLAVRTNVPADVILAVNNVHRELLQIYQVIKAKSIPN